LCNLNFAIAPSHNELKLVKSSAYTDEKNAVSILAFYSSKSGNIGIVRSAKKHIIFGVFDKKLTKIRAKVMEKPKQEIIVGDLFLLKKEMDKTYPMRFTAIFMKRKKQNMKRKRSSLILTLTTY